MYRGQRVGVVVPAYNEERLIEQTIATIPSFVDHIVVVDDASSDTTAEIVREAALEEKRIVHITHAINQGVGAAIRTGYLWCRDHDVDIAAVMAGDSQMDPEDLPAILDPVVNGQVDYAKGNRLITGEAWKKIPRIRYLGNSMLTFLTKIASGYWHVTDSQTGYTAIGRHALHTIPIEEIFPRYGMPNDLLVTLNIYNMRVIDVPVKPVYHIGETSGIKLCTAIPNLSLLMLRLFTRRMIQKYVIRDFHPLVLFYSFGSILLGVNLPLTLRLFAVWADTGLIPSINALAILFCSFMGLQSVLFAMLFDMEANRHLNGNMHTPWPSDSNDTFAF